MSSKEDIQSKNQVIYVHRLGYRFCQKEGRQVFFRETEEIEPDETRQLMETFSIYCKMLQKNLASVKNILVRLLRNSGQTIEQLEEKSTEELVEEVELLFLEKEKENDELRCKNQSLQRQLHQNIIHQSSEHQHSVLELISDQDATFIEPSPQSYRNGLLQKPTQEVGLYRNSEDSTKTRSIYKPRVLFQIGKEVTTINQISSRKITSDINATSKNTSIRNSIKQVRAFNSQGNRLSIDAHMIKNLRADEKECNSISPSEEWKKVVGNSAIQIDYARELSQNKKQRESLKQADDQIERTSLKMKNQSSKEKIKVKFG